MAHSWGTQFMLLCLNESWNQQWLAFEAKQEGYIKHLELFSIRKAKIVQCFVHDTVYTQTANFCHSLCLYNMTCYNTLECFKGIFYSEHKFSVCLSAQFVNSLDEGVLNMSKPLFLSQMCPWLTINYLSKLYLCLRILSENKELKTTSL